MVCKPEPATESTDEIVVTPEMLAAGLAELPVFEPSALGVLDEGTLVSRVYVAMVKARPPSGDDNEIH